MQCLQRKCDVSKESTFEVDKTGSIAAPVKLTAARTSWGQYDQHLRYDCKASADPFARRTPVRNMSDNGATWTKQPQNDFRGSIATDGVNNGGKGGSKEEEGGIGKKKPVVAAAAEAAAPNSFDSLFEDGLRPGNEIAIYAHL